VVQVRYIMEARLPLAGEKAIRYRPAIVSLRVTTTENVRLYALLPI